MDLQPKKKKKELPNTMTAKQLPMRIIEHLYQGITVAGPDGRRGRSRTYTARAGDVPDPY